VVAIFTDVQAVEVPCHPSLFRGYDKQLNGECNSIKIYKNIKFV